MPAQFEPGNSVVSGLVSVIIPVYNAERFLPEALASIEAQGDPALEVIVVDDGSVDKSADIVRAEMVRAEIERKSVAVRYFYQENAGPAAARNRGLTEARGELIAFLDADDLWPAGKLARQRQRLTDAPEIDAVLGRIAYKDLAGAEACGMRFEDQQNAVSHIHLGSGLYRRSTFERVGRFDESMRFSEDQDWFLRAREARLRLTILEDITLLYRRHEANMTRGRGLASLGVMRALHQSIERRRVNGALANLPRWSACDEKSPLRVSVIVPVFNGAALLGEAIESLLAQDYPNLEIVVVDDGSTDNSREVAARYPVSLIAQANGGPGAARNAGVAVSTGELLGFLDQDDLWTPDRIHTQVQALRLAPEAEGVMGWQRFEIMPGHERPAWLRKSSLGVQRGEAIHSMLVRRTAFARVGSFDESFVTASDTDWLLRAKHHGLRWIRQGFVALRHRIHRQNQSFDVQRQHEELTALVRRSVMRVRAEGASG
jgi:glycosyltransferase involved in cell wall biosynthesis